jgi:hypothetical protein
VTAGIYKLILPTKDIIIPYKSKVKYSIPVTDLRGLEGARRLRLPDF